MSARKREQEEPPIQVKTFTLEEIPHAITKLRRRIEEVKALKTEGVFYRDQLRMNAEHNIRDTILEVFGANSPEYKAHQYHNISIGEIRLGKPTELYQADFQNGLDQTVTLLEGLVSRIEERRNDLGHDSTARIQSAFEGLELHPRIAAVASELYRDGHYRNAVQDAAIALVNLVKEKSRRHDLDGAGLMTTVFSKKSPILAFNDLKDQTEQDEQEGMMHLFVGAVLALRNPRSHALLVDSAEEALEYIGLLSLLAKRTDQARRL
jgi:uncharacterized protein (TIGR02391 family)